jgi:hypothetical protein
MENAERGRKTGESSGFAPRGVGTQVTVLGRSHRQAQLRRNGCWCYGRRGLGLGAVDRRGANIANLYAGTDSLHRNRKWPWRTAMGARTQATGAATAGSE